MRQTLLLGALASLAVLSAGCALTDYGTVDSPLNKSHGITGCVSDDRFANSQQTIERETRELLLAAVDPISGLTICTAGPEVTTDLPTLLQARDWNRFLGSQAGVLDVSVEGNGPGAGTWSLGGVKDLPDGSRRLNTFYTPLPFSGFSCGAARAGGRLGAPEGAVVGEGYTEPGAAGPRRPGTMVETIAIDRGPTQTATFCQNVVAMSPHRANEGYSTFVGLLGRAGEGRLTFTPITRRDGLNEFFAGQPITATVAGVQVTGHGALNADGTIRVTIDELSNELASYRAETPVYVDVDPASGARALRVYPTSSELRLLAAFAVRAGLTDREIVLPTFIPELGLSLPERISIMLVGEQLRRFVNDGGSSGEGSTGFGD